MEKLYKRASQLKLRFDTDKGILSVENLWDLSLQSLDKLAVKLAELKEKSTNKSFLSDKTEADELATLRFELVLDILNTKKEWQDANNKKQENKAHNEKILRLIETKESEALAGMTIEQLKEMLK